ncbi:uncharacterized protein LOC100569583 isoform X2 [Acyrthosiphon pisum]|uniref:Uncharacterized protein n=1 Tax=Acyrthosiphon pisum TaxID=7029 RepID=A0A8R2H8T2_ACYPI|nr:uncharacterized protein LOC100569583 isoform X2 [Acyrthosiphon pisum]|eukprot:XP_016660324.1 PREDICTED: uncharacterized protein LOC100569583 isoform X2 [Acyrthosiphon pisum]
MTSRNGDSLPQPRWLQDKTNVHLDSMSGNDAIRFRNLQQWYTTSVLDVKRDFLRNVLDVCGDPLFLFTLQKIFDCRAYRTGDMIAAYNIGDGCSDVRPAEDNESSSLDLTASTDDHSDWFDGLSKHVRLAAFVRLAFLGGTSVMTEIREHLDRLIKSNGNLPSFRNSNVKNTTEMQNSNLTIFDDLLLLTDRLSDSDEILSITNLDKNKAKITDVVYRDYMERTNEWKNKLDSFEQKYHAIRRTTEPDSDLAQMLSVWHVIPAGEKLLSDPSRKETNATPTSTNGNAEHIPLSSSHTLASVTEYKKARNLIDRQIDRRLKIKTRQLDDETELDDCGDFDLHAAIPFDNNCWTKKDDTTHILKGKGRVNLRK